jgi:glutamate/tyrosine decarboxylase-like PLP-dependent enzyme
LSEALDERVLGLARRYLRNLGERPVRPELGFRELVARLGAPLSAEGKDPASVVEELANAVEPGLVASAGPRYFGFVIGGSLPAARGADVLASAWDQNAGLCVSSPAAAAVEAVTSGFILDLLGLPRNAGVGFVTGGQMANFSALAAARHAVLAKRGWDVERDGLTGAPKLRTLVSEQAHATIFAALRLLGLGSGRAVRIPVDAQGRMLSAALERELSAGDGPAIVCAQAGNVNTGAFDPVQEIAALAHARGAWLHVDGAFGLWAAACPSKRHLLRGVEHADSWATDAHKWLNVPYDSGIAIVADAEHQRAAFTKAAAYLVRAAEGFRDPHDYTPESSRRARGFAVYAALRSLGRAGVAELVERDCRLAVRMAERLAASPRVRILNDVVLNQVLVGLEPPDGRDQDGFTRAVIARVQAEGTCWLSGTRWAGREALRVSFSHWATREDDVDRSAAAILECVRREAAATSGA